ncbi:MAG TPA: GspE/PulE family protein [bacterium]|nr:GspE/PulE family protein [bacterium]
MSKQTSNKLLDFLISASLISNDQLNLVNQALANGEKGLDEVLIELEILDPEKLTEIKASLSGLSYIDLSGVEIDDETLNILPAEVANNYRAVCFHREVDEVQVGLLDADNIKAIEAIGFLAKKNGLRVKYFLISKLSFEIAFKKYQTVNKEITSALELKAKEDEEEVKKNVEEDDLRFEEITKSAPISKIISAIIRHGVELGASDIHIEPLPKESRIRYRVDGILKTSLVLPRNIHDSLISRVKVMSKLKLDETRVPQDGRISLNIDNRDIDFRVSILPLMGQEKAVMRILDVSRGAPTIEALGFAPNHYESLKKSIDRTSGLILITGPTGSGKTTTLYSLLNILNKEDVNISTLEDPVEYFLKGINQSQVRPEVNFTFSTGLRSLLRQDPDIMMVGEIRDNETAELAVHASLTGHLVLSTLHTNDAIGAIPRLVDMKIEPFLLNSSLVLVVAQRLVRLNCDHCLEEEKVSDDVLSHIRELLAKVPTEILQARLPNYNPEQLKFSRGVGCPYCGQTGYRSRSVIAEIIEVNDKVRDMIMQRNDFDEESIKATQPFINMEQDGFIKALQGLTTIEEVMRVIQSE